MKPYTKTNFLWLFKLLIPMELEEIVIWKLHRIGITSFAFEANPQNIYDQTLLIWLPTSEWNPSDRNELEKSLGGVGKTMQESVSKGSWEQVNNEDWSLTWKKHWRPDPVGKSLLILPNWLEVPKKLSNRSVLRLDPGCAFGTGSHPSTRLCLESLEKNSLKGIRVLDIGCGSGILGLASLSLGAESVLAADIDSLAISASNRNAHLNGLPKGSINVVMGSIEKLEEELKGDFADLILCNILAPVIKTLLPKFDRVLKPTGKAFLSGLLLEQTQEISLLCESLGWSVVALKAKDGWGLIEIFGRNSHEHNDKLSL